MSRTQRRDSELRDASDHFLYEVQMLRATALGLASGLVPNGPIHDAILESFIIHARNILHFLYPEDAKPSDVISDDYFPDSTSWQARRGDIPAGLLKLRHRANKEVAHLTYDRLDITPEEKRWDFLTIMRDLDGKVQSFTNLVSPMKLGEGWPELGS